MCCRRSTRSQPPACRPVCPPALLPARRRLSAPLFYWLYWSATVLVIPYLSLYWRQLGFSGSQIGVLVALRPWAAALSGATLRMCQSVARLPASSAAPASRTPLCLKTHSARSTTSPCPRR